ncbi:protein of unknown function [Hyphomicrobium sp. MC1]|nr:protein of unknown function [Hyphomicrobium sp. MC1]
MRKKREPTRLTHDLGRQPLEANIRLPTFLVWLPQSGTALEKPSQLARFYMSLLMEDMSCDTLNLPPFTVLLSVSTACSRRSIAP